ncbi:lanC-like protein 2 [Asbolus verrucosus]|uniref:LanC-like protein 2 n=1 Tax=Asbolus verrucosus TaxID=1661398 RepID=A0A482VDX1_ASBVE|nr:lanC-like protein 2 [Asbolus verrucosus]
MSRDRFFNNPYPDYAPENACCILENGEIKYDSKIALGLEDKWQNTLSQFRNLDYNDYSVYTGTAGIALLKLKKDSENPQNLEEVRQLLSLERLKKKRLSFLCGDAGPLAIGAVIDYKLGKNSYFKCIEGLKIMGEEALHIESDLPNEYLYGRTGYLFAVLYCNKNISPPPFDESFIRKIIEAIFICGKNEAKAGIFKCPLMYQWHGSYYLGAAHGLSGILYLLLQVTEYLTDAELHTLIRPTIEYLSSLKFPSGNFPSSVGRDNDKYVQWCHGAPGFLYLFCMAYKIFGDSKYLQLALECGDVIWSRGLLRKGYSICHGVAGNAYCFLELYQTTHDEKHLYRAVKFAEWCFDYSESHVERPPDRPFSLFEGMSGPMYLLLDIQKPMEAKFPGYTL